MGKNLIRFLILVFQDVAWFWGTWSCRRKERFHLPAGQVALMSILGSLLLIPAEVFAQDVRTYIPLGARTYAPELVRVQLGSWPDSPEAWTMAGQVEQESCITLRHKRCWNPHAELKTSREYGFGFGQITTAYRADGSVRFNKFEELKAAHPQLRGWEWAERYRADYQLTALVLMTRNLFWRVEDASSTLDRWAFTLSGYNGGAGGVLQDRLLCSHTRGCDPSKWFGHVEFTSLKTRRVNPGYGKSAFEINREYAHFILDLRRMKYRAFWESSSWQ